jgi:hypothetical protein
VSPHKNTLETIEYACEYHHTFIQQTSNPTADDNVSLHSSTIVTVSDEKMNQVQMATK